MRVFIFLMIKVDFSIIWGNLKVDFLIEIFMRFLFKSHWIQIPMPLQKSYITFNSIDGFSLGTN